MYCIVTYLVDGREIKTLEFVMLLALALFDTSSKEIIYVLT
jgi:hypothetical protein